MRSISLILLIAVTALSSGCGTTTYAKKEIIPQSDYTMKEIYDNKGVLTAEQKSAQKDTDQHVAELQMRPIGQHQSLDIYKQNRLDNDSSFHKLPNPTLYLYFPARFSKDGNMPIPAWMTEFKMYDKDEYALPGEMMTGARQ